MKKFAKYLAILVAIMMVMSFSGCGLFSGSDSNDDEENEDEDEDEDVDESEDIYDWSGYQYFYDEDAFWPEGYMGDLVELQGITITESYYDENGSFGGIAFEDIDSDVAEDYVDSIMQSGYDENESDYSDDSGVYVYGENEDGDTVMFYTYTDGTGSLIFYSSEYAS